MHREDKALMVTANGNKSIEFVHPSIEGEKKINRNGSEKQWKQGRSLEKRRKQEKKTFNCVKFTNQKSIHTTEKWLTLPNNQQQTKLEWISLWQTILEI